MVKKNLMGWGCRSVGRVSASYAGDLGFDPSTGGVEAGESKAPSWLQSQFKAAYQTRVVLGIGHLHGLQSQVPHLPETPGQRERGGEEGSNRAREEAG